MPWCDVDKPCGGGRQTEKTTTIAPRDPDIKRNNGQEKKGRQQEKKKE
jgi:hypothetical protein